MAPLNRYIAAVAPPFPPSTHSQLLLSASRLSISECCGTRDLSRGIALCGRCAVGSGRSVQAVSEVVSGSVATVWWGAATDIFQPVLMGRVRGQSARMPETLQPVRINKAGRTLVLGKAVVISTHFPRHHDCVPLIPAPALARGERPCSRRSTQKRDEVAPPHV